MTKQTPKAQAVLIEHDGVHVWRVPFCPLCGGEHTHGGGRVGVDDPDDLLGHRVAHCKPGGGYELVRRGTRKDGQASQYRLVAGAAH